MKIALDQSVELEFNRWSLDQAGEIIRQARVRHKERGDDVLRGMLTLLLFGQIEQQSPGTIEGIMNESAKIADALNGLKSEK